MRRRRGGGEEGVNSGKCGRGSRCRDHRPGSTVSVTAVGEDEDEDEDDGGGGGGGGSGSEDQRALEDPLLVARPPDMIACLAYLPSRQAG